MNRPKIIVILILSLALMACKPAGTIGSSAEIPPPIHPKLVVGVVVDQMRYDYLYKYWEDYGEGGIKKLLANGFSCENHHYSYAPTYTGPGHASIYTGTTPTNHGIIGNDWYDRKSDTSVYCTQDQNYKTLGSLSVQGQMSPSRMISSTICDEMKLFTNFRSKSIGISIKDRGAILPAGHYADAAYWFEGGTLGSWITSTRYMDELPEWVKDVNSEKKADEYLKKGWQLLADISVYDESGEDNVPYENPFSGKLQAAFPYDLETLAPGNEYYSILKSTPWGNTLTTEMAIAAIKGENLGKDEFTDFLAISYSSTDYAGHKFGPQSLELQDIYLRLDKEFEALIDFLDQEVGRDNYTLFLTADHGVVEVPALTQDHGLPSGTMRPAAISDSIKNMLKMKYGTTEVVDTFMNAQFYLNKEEIEKLRLDRKEIESKIVEASLKFEGIQMAFSSEVMVESHFSDGVMSVMQKGYNQSRSGDVLLVPKPGWLLTSYLQGTSHGSPYSYDTHVPLLFYGSGIQQGQTYQKTNVEDIAPTLAAMLRIQMPSASTGNPILQVLGE